MTSGGSRARSGPAPDRNSLRSAGQEWATLPAEGYAGPVPVWPLEGQTKREAEVWTAHWRKPQAEKWAADRMEWQVAFFVRRFVEAEVPNTSAGLSTLVKQLAEDLGLTRAGMDRNRWRIAAAKPTEPASSAGSADVIDITGGSSRDRFARG